jgi:hypothetical protein
MRYTHDMKLVLKNFTYRHYVRYLRKLPTHMQHVHAFVIAGTITGLIAAFILYTDYGFWHEKYQRDDAATDAAVDVPSRSMTETLSDFFGEASSRLSKVKQSGSGFLEGTDTYTSGGSSTEKQ